LQQELPANFVGTLSYLGSHGVHLLEEGATNLLAYNSSAEAWGPQTQFPECAPTAGEPAGSCSTGISWRGSAGMSTYNGLSASLRRSFSRGLLVAANYMWSHEIDNGSNGSGDGDEVQPQNQACQTCDTASGAWDARSVINGNAVYQLPFGPGQPMLNQPGILSAIAGNWQLTTDALARTGFPVNVVTALDGPDGNPAGTQRPLLTGQPLTPPGGRTVAEWFNPAAFQIPPYNSQNYASVFGPRRATCCAGRGPGKWISVRARRFRWRNARNSSSVRSSTTSSITPSWVSRGPRATSHRLLLPPQPRLNLVRQERDSARSPIPST